MLAYQIVTYQNVKWQFGKWQFGKDNLVSNESDNWVTKQTDVINCPPFFLLYIHDPFMHRANTYTWFFYALMHNECIMYNVHNVFYLFTVPQKKTLQINDNNKYKYINNSTVLLFCTSSFDWHWISYCAFQPS